MGENRENILRIAILDLYEGFENQGMRCINDIILQWGVDNDYRIEFQIFDVRLKKEIPDINLFDSFISSGGPGSPLETVGQEWDNKFIAWVEAVNEWNNNAENIIKKQVFFICHSFQLACRHFELGNVCKRKSTSFGVFPIHRIKSDCAEVVFDELKDPFYAVDSRDYQVIEPNHTRFKEMGATILAIEKERAHVPYERAVMAIRFNEYMIGTQFHPEADAVGMRMYLLREDKKKSVIENHGEEKWQSMTDQLQDPDKILYTYKKVLPNFLSQTVQQHNSVLC